MTLQARPSASDRLPHIGAIQAGIVSVGSLALISFGLVILVIDSARPDLPSSPLRFWLMIAGVFGLFAGALLALYSYFQTRRLARLLASDKLLAHWTIGGERWKSYIARERARATRELLIFTLILLGLVLAVEVLPSLFGRVEAANEPADWGTGLIVGAWLIGINALGWAANQLRLYILGRRTTNAIYITTEGVVLNQQWHRWRKFGCWLESVTYESQPDKELIFTYHKRSARPTTSEVKLYVPVPDSYVQEARRLVAHFKQG